LGGGAASCGFVSGLGFVLGFAFRTLGFLIIRRFFTGFGFGFGFGFSTLGFGGSGFGGSGFGASGLGVSSTRGGGLGTAGRTRTVGFFSS